MTSSAERQPRRSDALSRERIIEATIDLLDTAGESALTVRALTAHLATGRGAIYHHVQGKEQLLAQATDDIVRGVFGVPADGRDPDEAIRALALGIFDALAAHPWVGAQLGRDPLQPAVRRIWLGIGSQLGRLGVTGPARSDAGAALVNYVLGASAQYAAGAKQLPDGVDRQAYLERVAAELTRSEPGGAADETAELLRGHDDRTQFLAGVDIFLAGIGARRIPPEPR